MTRKEWSAYLVLFLILTAMGWLYSKRALAAEAIVSWSTGPQPAGVVITGANLQTNNCTSTWPSNVTIPTALGGSYSYIVQGVTPGTHCYRVLNVATGGVVSPPSPVVTFVTVDTDNDGVSNPRDNCTQLANNSDPGRQCDGDNDGYGNRCDGDLNNDGFTNSFDTPLFQAQLGVPWNGTYNSADINCDGHVNSFDTPLFRALIGRPPGPSGLH